MSTMTRPAQAVSTRFTPDTLARIDEVAQNRQCSRSEIIKEAVDGYLDAMAWLEGAVRQGMDDLKGGRRISHADVKAKYRALGVNVD